MHGDHGGLTACIVNHHSQRSVVGWQGDEIILAASIMNDGSLTGGVIFNHACVKANARVPRSDKAAHGKILAELSIGLLGYAAHGLLKAKPNAQHTAHLHGRKRRSNAVTSGVGD